MGEIDGFSALPKMPEEYQVLLDKLFSARRAAALYQPDHPIALQAREAASSDLVNVLRRQSKLSLAAVDEGLLLDRRLYRQTADSIAFGKRFRQRGITRVVFKAGMDASELLALLNLLDTDPARIRAKGGPANALKDAGVTNIAIFEVSEDAEEQAEQTALPQQPPELPLDRLEALLAEMAAVLAGETDSLEEDQYFHLIALLRDPNLITRLLSAATALAGRSQPDRPKAATSAHIVQRLESLVLSHSAGDWEEVKHKVREAVAALPPAIRPKVFTLQASTWKQEGRASQGDMPTPQSVSIALSELAKALGDLRGVPPDISGATGGVAPGVDAQAYPPSDGPKGRLLSLLEGMATMHIAPPPPAEEMADMMQMLDVANDSVNLSWVLLELLEKEQKLETYSKLATELERLAKVLLEQGHCAPALHLLLVLTNHANEQMGYPAWQRLRAAGALQAIGPGTIMDFLCTVFKAGNREHVKAAAEIARGQGKQAVPSLIGLLAQPLASSVEHALVEVLVKCGNSAVPELAQCLQSRYSQAGMCIVTILSEIGTDDALKALAKGLESKDVLVRLAVVQSLGKKANDFAASLLIPALRDPNPAVRRAAANALGELRNPLAVPALARIVTAFSWNYSDLAERLEAVMALGKIGDEQALAVLTRVVKAKRLLGRQRYAELRRSARACLERADEPDTVATAGNRPPMPAKAEM